MTPDDRAIADLDAAAAAEAGDAPPPPGLAFCAGCPARPRAPGCDPACLEIALATELPL